MWESLKCEGPIYIIIIHYPLVTLERGLQRIKGSFCSWFRRDGMVHGVDGGLGESEIWLHFRLHHSLCDLTQVSKPQFPHS